MTWTLRFACGFLAVTLLAILPLRAQDTEAPRTHTDPSIENRAFPYAPPREVDLADQDLQALADSVTYWVAAGELVGAEILIVKDGMFEHGGADETIALAFPHLNAMVLYFTQSRGPGVRAALRSVALEAHAPEMTTVSNMKKPLCLL